MEGLFLDWGETVKSWRKFLALILAYLQLFGCADQGFRDNYDTTKLSVALPVHQLKAVGNNTAWVDGYFVARSNDLKIPMKIRFLRSDPAGLAFLIGMSNRSNKKLLLSNRQFYCRQKNSQSAQALSPVLSRKQVMAIYDKQIEALEPAEKQASMNAGQFIGLAIFVIVLLVLLYKSGANSSAWGSPSGASSKTSQSSQNDARQQMLNLKHQLQELMLTSKTLQPGEQMSTLIVCPFNSLGDSGLSIIYRDFIFEYSPVDSGQGTNSNGG